MITAALAASLLIPSLANAGQGGDKRRQEFVRKELEGEQTINKPDVTRFRSLLDRFDSILSGITLDKEEEQGQADPEKFEDVKVNRIDRSKEQNDLDDGDISAINSVIPNNADFVTNENKKTDNDLTALVETNIGETIFNNEVNEGDVNVAANTNTNVNVEVKDDTELIAMTQNENIESTNEISELFTPPEDVNEKNKQLNENLDITNVSKDLRPNTEVSNNLYNMDMTQDNSPKTVSGFTGVTATPDAVSVSTKFSTGGGLFDRFEAASSLRTYGAYS